ncbi:hypothetical protein PsYK624_081370 [Phanerochaete sordida]|uniref:Uncharacterized protein n=1 Tax=Phanerochaete sordida TaxID=48140 RepID=A0A9P3GDW6_9APHY|nr:hypothetical protein PsYK624_081370 [Phanerochaete sordida]
MCFCSIRGPTTQVELYRPHDANGMILQNEAATREIQQQKQTFRRGKCMMNWGLSIQNSSMP